jgi:hypothetical protein
MRCRNCGDLGHKTHECQEYGPWYPEPGVPTEHYAAEKLRIDTLVAGDILAEHEADHEGLDPL